MNAPRRHHVLVTGGAGYVGSSLVPKLLRAGHRVNVLDLYWYGRNALAAHAGNPRLKELIGDIRDPGVVDAALAGCDTVIHLACVSNDPSFDLDPDLGRSINHDAFRPFVRAARTAGVRRFIYASSSSVYGIKTEESVTEDLPLEPLTDYSRYKALCEEILNQERRPGFATLSVRPATVCGYSPRPRLDLIVNILTNHAVNNGRVRVFGGAQHRPNLHIEDMTDFYLRALDFPEDAFDGQAFNVGSINHAVIDLASIVQRVVGAEVELAVEPTDDPRSYRICSDRALAQLGYAPKRTVDQAVGDLVQAFNTGRIPEPLNDSRYYNIQRMREVLAK